MKSRLPGTFATVALLLLSNLSAQSAKLEADVNFIRGLVKELRFIDLAQYEVEQLKKIHKDSSDFKLIAQLAIEVSLEGAKRDPDRVRRIVLYREAIDKSMEFIERYEGETVARDAQVTLSDACIEFGFFLNEELEVAREEDPDRVAELEEKAAAVFRQGVAASNKCEAAFKAAGKKTEAFVAWMRRGILLREHARAVPKDRGYLCDQAGATLEDLIFEVGEETLLGQKALFEMSKIEEVKGDLDAAIQSYRDAIDAIYEALTDDELNIGESAQRLMFQMMQEIYDRLATVTFKGGRTSEIEKLVLEFDKRVKEFRTEANPLYWDSLLLTQAQVQAGSMTQSAVSDALKTAKEINKNHPADFVGLKAKNLIRDILRHSSDLVTGELLLEVAIGDYQAKEYEAAIAGFKRAINGMDAETKKKLGFDTWIYVARCNERMQRFLEASMAYSRALAEHGTRMKSDAEAASDQDMKSSLKRAANKATSCMNKVMTASSKAPIFNGLAETIKQQLADFDPTQAEKGDYREGLKAKYAKKFAEATRFFFKVSKELAKYELARGHGIECLFRDGKYGEARAKINELRAHVKATEIAEDDRERRAFRPQAMAWVHYTEGRMLYEEAKGGKDRKPDLTKFREVERHFLVFESVHKANATTQMGKVHEMLGHAYLEMGDQAKASARYTKLKALGETRPDAHKALGVLMFETYRKQVKALQTEAKGTKPADMKVVDAKLTEARNRAMDVGLDYAKTVGKPAYGILYNTMRLAQSLRAWPKCEWAAEKILKLYGKAGYESLRQIKPLLGYAKLRQPGRMQEALDVLNEAEKELGAGTKRTSAYYMVLKYKALALGGWPMFDSSGINYQPNRGMGKPDEAYDIYWHNKEFRKFMKHSQRNPKYSIGWYEYHLELYFFCRQAQRIDSKFKTRAETFFNIAKATDNFATLKNLGAEGAKVANLFNFIQK
jgi:tetratricopeptide (TPR) repeat protein